MSSRACIMILTTSFPTHGDGSEAAGGFVLDTALALSKHVPVRVVAPGCAEARELWSEGLEVFRYAAPSRPLSTLSARHLLDILAICRVLVGGRNAALRAARAGGPVAHVFALWALPSGYWARAIQRRLGVPYSVWTLGSDIWSLARIPIVKHYLRAVLRNAANRFADGLELVRDTEEICGLEASFLPSTRTIGGARIAPLRTTPPYNLLFLGRWHPNKGIDLLLDALAQLSEADWGRIGTVEICGGGPLDALVRNGVECLRKAGRPVRLGGFVDKAGAEAAILRADYLLLPSRVESIPVVFSDALKLDCPVLATPVGDLPGLLENQDPAGLLASEVSSHAIAHMVGQALGRSPEDFRSGMSRTRSVFDMDSVVTRLLRGASI